MQDKFKQSISSIITTPKIEEKSTSQLFGKMKKHDLHHVLKKAKEGLFKKILEESFRNYDFPEFCLI